MVLGASWPATGSAPRSTKRGGGVGLARGGLEGVTLVRAFSGDDVGRSTPPA